MADRWYHLTCNISRTKFATKNSSRDITFDVYDLPYNRWKATMYKQIQNFDSTMTRYGNLTFQTSGQLHISFCQIKMSLQAMIRYLSSSQVRSTHMSNIKPGKVEKIHHQLQFPPAEIKPALLPCRHVTPP